MAKVAHLILSHKSPEAVGRLIGAIAHTDANVFIHVDKKVEITPFIHGVQQLENTHFISNRTKITWGAFSMVQATLNALKEILSKNKHFDFINLLSEADYPLKAADKIHSYLDAHAGKSFMETHFSDSPWWDEAQIKIQKYHMVDYNFFGKYALERLINQFTPNRKIPMNLMFTGRSQWMTLSVSHVRYILSFTDKNPQITRFFKHTWGPDEFFFQTILFNSPFRDEIVNDNLRYIDWSEGAASPKTLTSENYPELASSGKFYARKFDIAIDPRILSMLDRLRIDTP